MFSSKISWVHAPPVVLFAVLLTGCTRQPASPPAARLAVLRLENLSGDPALDWVGRALGEVIGAELSGARNPRVIPSANIHAVDRVLGGRAISAPGISAEADRAARSLLQRMNARHLEQHPGDGKLAARIASVVPEPGSLALALLGLLGVAAVVRCRRLGPTR